MKFLRERALFPLSLTCWHVDHNVTLFSIPWLQLFSLMLPPLWIYVTVPHHRHAAPDSTSRERTVSICRSICIFIKTNCVYHRPADSAKQWLSPQTMSVMLTDCSSSTRRGRNDTVSGPQPRHGPLPHTYTWQTHRHTDTPCCWQDHGQLLNTYT